MQRATEVASSSPSRLGLPFTTDEVAGIADRDHALLWIEENQLGRRNLSDDQRAVIALSVAERRSEMAREERARAAGEARAATAGRDDTGKMTASLPDTSTGKLDEATPERRQQRDGTRTRVAKETKVSERKLRSAAEIKKADPAAAERIRRGESTIVQERAGLNAAARATVAQRELTPFRVQQAECGCSMLRPRSCQSRL